MNGGTSPQTDQYYGYGSGSAPSPSVKEIRKMRRTELSREKKSNASAKSISRERDSSLSNNAKSRTLAANTTSILKTDIASSLKNSQSKYGENNLPSSTDVQNATIPSIRKSRLQISTGVIGIKMDSVSPTTVVSHPSKVLIVNESSSGKKGSKSKKQKSILYVEYNNFMTQLNNNKLSKNSKNHDEKNSQQNTNVKSPTSMKILSPEKNKKQFQQFSNLLPSNLDNEYFAGMSRNCISPVSGVINKKETNRKTENLGLLGYLKTGSNIKLNEVKGIQSPKKQGSTLKLSRNGGQTVQTPKNQTSIANLSITSTTKNRLQSSRLGSVSPRLFKIQQNGHESKLNKNKISIHDITALKEKNHQQNSKANNKIRDSRDSVRSSRSTKKQSYGIQVNIASNIFPKEVNILPSTHLQNTNMNQEYFHKLKKEENHTAQKIIKLNEAPNQKQYKTEKQISLSRGKQKSQTQSQNAFNTHTFNSGYQNPYNLTKNQNLVNNYQKKKNQPQFNELINESKGKSMNNQITYSPIVQFNLKDSKQMESNFNSGDDSQSVISRTSSKRGRKLMKISEGNNLKSSDSKISIKSHSKSKLNIPPSPKASRQLKFQPKTPQPYSTYKDSSSSNSGQKSSHNQEKLTPQSNHNQHSNLVNDIKTKVHKLTDSSKNQNKIKYMEEYNSAYYTPNPYSLKNSRRIKNDDKLNFVPEDKDKNEAISELSSDNSGPEEYESQSEVSSMESIEDNLSMKSGKLSNVSEARLKRQQIANKSKLRSSRNSLKSNQQRSRKNLKLNPVSRLDSSIANSMVSEKDQNNQSQTISRNQIKENDIKEQQFSDDQSKKNHQRVRSTTYEGVKFLKASKNQLEPKENMYKSSVLRNEQQSRIESNNLSGKKSQAKISHMTQKPLMNQQSNMRSNMKQESNIINSKQKDSFEPRSVFQTNHQPSYNQMQLKVSGKSKQVQSKQKLSNFEDKKNTSVNEDSYLGRSQYKKELEVENVESEIQHMVSSNATNNQLTNTFKAKLQQSMVKTQNHHSEQSQPEESSVQVSETPQNKKHHIESESDLQKSAYSIQSVKRIGKRQSIKKSIHATNIRSSEMISSKIGRSNISIKSGRNLKPLNIENPTVDDFLAYIEEYDMAIGFLYLYVENTVAFYYAQDNEDGIPQVQQFKNRVKTAKSKKYEENYEKLAFLVMKKYLYEKNRIIKCLRGLQANIFNLTGLQIPQKILKKFINHQQTKQKLKQFELETKQLFKQMEEKFRSLRLKAENKKDKLIKLQTPYDDFTRSIVSMLMEELNELTTEIDDLEVETGSKLSSSNPSLPLGTKYMGPKSLTSVIAQEILTSEQRAVEVMEIVFLLSELQGRKVKKLELLNISEIDFEVFYENHIDKLLITYEYFEALKYPSDKVENQKKVK